MEQERKIRLIVSISDFRVGGAQKVVADLINHFNDRKFEIHLLTFFNSGNEENFFNEIGSEVQIHKLNFKGFYDIKSVYQLYKLLKKIDADVVWSHLFFSNTFIRLLKPLFKFRVVIVEHNTYVFRTKFEKVVNRLLSFLTFKIVAVSEYVARYTSRDENIPFEKFKVIHNGVDFKKFQSHSEPLDNDELFNEFGIPKDAKIFLNIGQLTTQKNQKLLIEAFSITLKKCPNSRLIILGEGKLRTELEMLVLQHNLKERVFLLGIKKDVSRYYAASDCFVLSSDFEGFPIVAIEALVAGLPIVSTPVSASDIFVNEGSNGFIVPFSDEKAMSEKMCNICQMSEDEINSFRFSSKQISKEFSIESVARNYEELLEEAVN